jgi:hypothetical protein
MEARCHPTAGPAIDPRPGNGQAADTPASGRWEDGVQASVLNVTGLLSPTASLTEVSIKVSRVYNTAPIASFVHVFIDAQCQQIAADPSTSFNFEVPFKVRIPAKTKWMVAWVASTTAVQIKYTATFQCGGTGQPAC